MRARHVLELARRVDAVTKLGSSASPRWSRVHAAHAWPTVAASSLAMARPPLAPPRGAAAAACPTPCHDEAIASAITSSSRLRTATLPCVAATNATAMPCCATTARSATVGSGLSWLRSRCRLALMVLWPHRPRPHLPPHVRTWSGHVSRSDCVGTVTSTADR